MGYLKYVNTKMGADSKMEFSRGNTLPLCQLPFGMCAFCPETEIPRNTPTWFYDPSKDYIDGVRLTHQPSPWIGDYGTFVFMVGDKKNDETSRPFIGFAPGAKGSPARRPSGVFPVFLP